MIPEIDAAMKGRTYFAWAERDTADQAASYIDDEHQGDAFRASVKVDKAWGVPFEQKIMVKAIALKRYQAAIQAATAKLNSPGSSDDLVGARMR